MIDIDTAKTIARRASLGSNQINESWPVLLAPFGSDLLDEVGARYRDLRESTRTPGHDVTLREQRFLTAVETAEAAGFPLRNAEAWAARLESLTSPTEEELAAARQAKEAHRVR